MLAAAFSRIMLAGVGRTGKFNLRRRVEEQYRLLFVVETCQVSCWCLGMPLSKFYSGGPPGLRVDDV